MVIKAKANLPPGCQFQLHSSRTATVTESQYAHFFLLPRTGICGVTLLVHKPLGLYYQLEKQNTLSKERL